MSTQYSGSLIIYGGKPTLEVMQEAQRRLQAAAGKLGGFELDSIIEVFFGTRDTSTHLQIGCRGLVLDELREVSKEQIQYEVFFSTESSYPDNFAKYLANKIALVDPNVSIKLDCIGDGLYRHKEVIFPSL